MKLAYEFYEKLGGIEWLSRIGERSESFGFDHCFMATLDQAESSYMSDLWADVRTQAQADLTSYLSKNHKNSYGGHWNKLAKESRTLVESAVGDRLAMALDSKRIPSSYFSFILTDINRAALEYTYVHAFPKAPQFFHKVFSIYSRGHFPCGWSGDFESWPKGAICIF